MDKSIKQKLFSGGLWVVGAKIVAFPCNLAVIAFLTRLLTPNEIGVYFLVFSLVELSTMFCLLGMERSVVRIISRSLALDLPERARDAIKYVLQLGLLSSAIVAVLLVSGIGQLISEKIFDSTLMGDIIYYPAIWLILFTLQRLVAESFRGLHDIRFATIFNGVIRSSIGAIVLGLILWSGEKADIKLALSAVIAAYAINLILAFGFLLTSTCKLGRKNTGLISRTELMRTSWRLYFTNILLLGVQQAHLWLLAFYSTKESVAVYGAVLSFMVLLAAVLQTVRLVIPSIVSELYAKHKYKEVEEVLRSSATIAGVPSLIGLLIIIFFGKTILLYTYGNYYTVGYAALLVLSGAHLINVLTGTPAVLLVMASKEKVLLLSAFISGIIGISLSIVLVDSLDYLGISIGAGVGMAIQNLLMAGYSLRRMSINTFMSFREVFDMTLKLRYRIANNIRCVGIWRNLNL